MSKKHINPHYQKVRTKVYSAEECIAALQSDKQVLSHLISKSESNLSADKELVRKVILEVEVSGLSKRIAVTGAPGVGKSSFLNTYCYHLAEQGINVAILPVDPTSYKSRGSILGDKTRMDNLVGHKNVFVKPMASALELGGVAPATAQAIALCERAGYEYVFVETVGVGQSEYAVRNLVDIFLLLLQAGGGDDLQGIKRGIMEMADLILVTKADGELVKVAEESRMQYRNALKFMLANDYNWKPQLGLYSIEESKYNETVSEMISSFYGHMNKQSGIQQLRSKQELDNYESAARTLFYQHMMKVPALKTKVHEYRKQIEEGEILHLEALTKLEVELEKSEV